MIQIKETNKINLKDIQRLWADGEVMFFVGFPNGLHQTDEEMQNWFSWITKNRPNLNHYCIFENDVFCGETFYQIDEEHECSAALDIKLFKFARGRGIASKALSFAIQEAFNHGAKKVWVDPNPNNVKAISLYERLGFKRKDMPKHLIDPEGKYTSIYMELEKK